MTAPERSDDRRTLAAWAHYYAARGWPVLPLRPRAKVPATSHGLHDATTDPETVERWWTEDPDRNIGLATGHRFDALDLDGDAALDELDRAAPVGARTIVGPIVVTGSGVGVHIYCQPTGRGNAAGLLPGVDWRGKGGYVVAPPSVHPDGHRYMVDPEYDLDTPLEAAPAWLWATREQHRATPSAPAIEGGTRYGTRALEGELGRLALVAEGTRNDELCRAAFRMGRLVGGGELDARTVAEALLAVALRIGLSETEAIGTIRSGLTSGMEQPRTAPERAS